MAHDQKPGDNNYNARSVANNRRALSGFRLPSDRSLADRSIFPRATFDGCKLSLVSFLFSGIYLRERRLRVKLGVLAFLNIGRSSTWL
jgi:hypothetical protein